MYDFIIQVKTLYLSYSRSEQYKRVFPLLFLGTLLFIPNKNDYTYGMILSGSFRGYFNSHWAGTSLATIYIILIGLFGYYIIQDRGKVLNNYSVNKLIGSTSIDKGIFILSVFCSKFLILLTTMLPTIIVACISQLIKKESLSINVIHICMPFIIFVIPVLFLIVSITCLFDSIEGLSGSVGSLIYFVLYYFLLLIEIMKIGWSPLGITDITNQVCLSLSKATGEYATGFTLIGNGYVVNKFLFEGMHYSLGILIGRGVTILFSMLILKTAMNNFQFFHNTSKNNLVCEKNIIKRNKLFVSINDLLLRLGLHEFTIYLADVKAWHIIILMFFMLLSFLFNAAFINIILFFIPMSIITKLILYGRETKLDELVKSTEYYNKQICVSWLSGIIILLFANSLVLIKYLLLSDYMAVYVVIAGCTIISASAVLIGELTKNENIIQIIYLLLLYIMADGDIFLLDFTGRNSGLWNYNMLVGYITVSFVIIILLTIRRKLSTGGNYWRLEL